MNDPVRTAQSVATFVGPAVGELGGPLGIVGRAMGLGGDELDAGVPGWAWFGIGMLAGAAAMYFLQPRVEAFVER